MDIRKYLHDKGFNWKEHHRPSGLTAIMNCPFCGDTEKSFAVKLDDGAFNCYRKNNCGLQGSFWDLQKLLGDKPVHSNYNIKIKTVEKKREYKKPTVQDNKLSHSAIEYLKSRGISEKTIDLFKVTQSSGALNFNYFKNGEKVGIKYRTKEKKMWREKDCEYPLYNMDMCDNNDTLYICEGEIDCMSLYEYNIISTSVPSGVQDLTWISEQWDWLEQFQKIFIILDNDDAGQEAVKNLVNRLGKWRCFNVVLPHKDVNECLTKGVKPEEIYSCIAKATEFNFDKLKTVEEFRDEIIEVITDEDAMKGISTKYVGLDNIIRGWRMKEVSIWTGQNGSGKSTFVNEIIIDLIRKKNNCFMFSGELPPKRMFGWMFRQFSKKGKLDVNDIDNCIEGLNNKLWIYDSTKNIVPELLFDAMEYAARKYDCKHFVIDSLMKIKLNYRKIYEEQGNFVDSLSEFAKEYNCHVHLIAHPRKAQTDDHTPDKVDIAGSGDITNLADNVFSLFRLSDEKRQKMLDKNGFAPHNILYVKKNREWGDEGKVNFYFQKDSKNFNEVIG